MREYEYVGEYEGVWVGTASELPAILPFTLEIYFNNGRFRKGKARSAISFPFPQNSGTWEGEKLILSQRFPKSSASS